jgi:hypothetical protein
MYVPRSTGAIVKICLRHLTIIAHTSQDKTYWKVLGMLSAKSRVMSNKPVRKRNEKQQCNTINYKNKCLHCRVVPSPVHRLVKYTVNFAQTKMILRLFAFSLFLVVGAFAQCQLCINGGAPSNPSVPIAAIGGITCQYFFFNSASVPPNSQQCIAVHLSENQALCGCAPVSVVVTPAPAAAAVTPSPVSRSDNVTTPEIPIFTPAPVVVPVTPAPVSSSDRCNVCLDGGVPGNPDATIPAVGGFSCRYFYDNAGFAPPGGQQCMTIHLPENQALCGCAPVSVVVTPAPAAAAVTPSPVSRSDNVTTPEIPIFTPAPAVPVTPAPVVSTSNKCVVCLNGGPPGNPNAIVGDFLCQYYFDNSDEIPPGGQQCTTLQLPENQAICGCAPGGSTRAPVVSSPIVAPPMAAITQAPIATLTRAPAAVTVSPIYTGTWAPASSTGAPDSSMSSATGTTSSFSPVSTTNTPTDSSPGLVSSAPSAVPPIDFPTLVVGAQRQQKSGAAEVSTLLVTSLCAGAMLLVVTMMVF